MSRNRRMYAPGAVFNEKRNTSRVWPVPPDALANALRELRRLRTYAPLLVSWIEDGHPTLTEDEHYRRFGEPYGKKGKKGAPR